MAKKNVTENIPAAPGKFWLLATKTPVAYALFLILIVFIYGQTWQYLLGKLDEDNLILIPLAFLQDWGNLGEAFVRDAFLNKQGDFYRPLQTVSLMLDAHLFFEKGSVFYFTNSLIHLVTCGLLFYLLRLWEADRPIALSLTVFYLVAPLFVSAVAWAPSRGDLLLTLFTLLTLVFFIRWMRSCKAGFAMLSILSNMAALFSKETAIMIPLMILVYFLVCRKEAKPGIPSVIMVFSGFLAAMIVYLILRSQVTGSFLAAGALGSGHIVENLRVFPETAAKFIIPVNLSPMPGYSVIPTLTGIGILLILFTAAGWAFRKKYWLVWFGLLWFILFTFPGTLHSHPFGSAAYDYLEHRAYLPAIGIIILLSGIFMRIGQEETRKTLAAGVIILSLAYGLFAAGYVRNYKTTLSFYQRVVSIHPSSAVAYHNRGYYCGYYLDDQQAALADFDRALANKRDYASAWVNKGVSLYMMNNKEAAIAQYDSAIRYDPRFFKAYLNKANALYELGKYDVALENYRKAAAINPSHYACRTAMGLICGKLNDLQGALREYSAAIAIDAGQSFAILQRGTVRYQLGDVNGACADWAKAAMLGDQEAAALRDRYCKTAAPGR